MPTTYLYAPPTQPTAALLNSVVYPGDLVVGGRQVWMGFQFLQWNRPTMLSGGNLTSLDSVILPMPKRVVDHQHENWMATSGDILQGVWEMSTGGMGTIDIIKALLARLVGSTDIGSEFTGAIGNPMLTMLYKAPDLKRHSFTWHCAPRNLTDSQNLRTIINEFQRNMLPSLGGANTLGYPNLVQPSFYPNQYMYTFKPCVIESAEVDYTAAGGPSFFASSQAPTIVSFNVNLVELAIWTQSDFTAGAAAVAA